MKLCLTLCETNPKQLQEKIYQYQSDVEMIELRLDALEEEFVPRIPADTSTDFLATCRPRREGGSYSGREGQRLKILSQAARAGCSWIDVEWDVSELPTVPSSCQVIRSRHLFQPQTGVAPGLLRELRSGAGDAYKLAVSISSSRQLVESLRALEETSTEDTIFIGMGVRGLPTRLLGYFLGNLWTYVHADQPAAEGQFSLNEARELYRLQSFKTAPAIYGVLGNPLGHSLSPLLHNQLFRHYHQDGLYLPVELDELDPWFEYVEDSQLDFRGFSVTIPFKIDVTRFIKTLSSPQSVNTLLRKGSWWVGLNTDYPAFLKPLLQGDQVPYKSALVLGTGGAAQTVVRALLKFQVEVSVAGRNRLALEDFNRRFGCRTLTLEELPVFSELLVNATPVGQAPGTDQLPPGCEELRFNAVYDLVYNPTVTRLIRKAQSQGIRTYSGREMFIEQAALQFRHWVGIDPDRELVSELLKQVLD